MFYIHFTSTYLLIHLGPCYFLILSSSLSLFHSLTHTHTSLKNMYVMVHLHFSLTYMVISLGSCYSPFLSKLTHIYIHTVTLRYIRSWLWTFRTFRNTLPSSYFCSFDVLLNFNHLSTHLKIEIKGDNACTVLG